MNERASFLVPIHQDKIMIQHRPDQTWGFFGGHRRSRETAIKCALREFREETGISPRERIREFMRHGNYTVYSMTVSVPYSRIYKSNETIGFQWIEPNRLKSLNLIRAFQSYSNSFINRMEGCMKTRSLSISTADAIEVLSVLKAGNRTDLAREFGQEVFGGTKVMAQADNEATLDGDSVKILNEKAEGIIEDFLKAIEKKAEGAVEADILKKHAIKLLMEKFGEGLTDEPTEEPTEEGETEDADNEEATEDTGEEDSKDETSKAD